MSQSSAYSSSHPRSIELFRALAAEEPGTTWTLTNMGVGLAATGRVEEAEDVLQRLSSVEPQTGAVLGRPLHALRDDPTYQALIAPKRAN